MKPVKSNGRKNRTEVVNLSSQRRPSAAIRRRKASLLMESLELRTLLASNVAANAIAALNAASITASTLSTSDSSHIYTGQPSTFGAVSANPGATDLSAASETALAALGQAVHYAPEYFILSSGDSSVSATADGVKGGPDQGEGPGGGLTPQQLAGAYVPAPSRSQTESWATAPARPSP